MSIVCAKDGVGWIINHEEFINNIYTSVAVQTLSSDNLSRKSFVLNTNLFEIITPFLNAQEAKNAAGNDGRSRRKRKNIEFTPLPVGNPGEVSVIKFALKELQSLQNVNSQFLTEASKEDFYKNNDTARRFSASYFNEICEKESDEYRGGNTSESPVLVDIKNEHFLIPNNSEFYCCDINKLTAWLPEGSKFDFILMDPPWWNKYVRRRKKNQETAGYKMMYNDEVRALPVERWLADGALVAVWCTNCAQHAEDIVSRWFPKWGVRLVATWYWLKVTRRGEPVCQFSPPPGKQPFERILFGARDNRTAPQPLDSQCIISVPSSIHSHKPPLVEVLKEFLPQNPKCLELFARYLLSHWTSAGNQVLALQNIKLFSEQKACST